MACYSAVLSTWKSRVLRGISFLPTEGIPALLPQQSLSRWACQIHCFQIWSCLLFAKEGQRYLVDIYLENRERKITSSWCSHCLVVLFDFFSTTKRVLDLPFCQLYLSWTHNPLWEVQGNLRSCFHSCTNRHCPKAGAIAMLVCSYTPPPFPLEMPME